MVQILAAFVLLAALTYVAEIAVALLLLAGLIFRTKETVCIILLLGAWALFKAYTVPGLITFALAIAFISTDA